MLFRKLPDTRRVDTEADQKKNMLNFEFHLFLLFSEKTGVRNTSSNYNRDQQKFIKKNTHTHIFQKVPM